MLISDKHRFIFIHVYKNAGASITKALHPFAIDPWKHGLYKILQRRMGISHPPSHPAYRYQSHIRAAELMEKIGRETYKSYFSFAVVRNPWSWQVSLYNYVLKATTHRQHELFKSFLTFDEYIEWRCTEEVRFQKDFIFSSDGEQLVDFIGRFERLDEDFATICSRIGISASLPRLNASTFKSYQSYYTEASKELLRKTFEPDITLFGYDFE
jgi:hypothetical protein